MMAANILHHLNKVGVMGRDQKLTDSLKHKLRTIRFLDTNGVLQSRPLARNVSWTLAGNSFYALTQWLILVILARLSGPESVGRFSIALAITSPVALFFGLNLRSVQATDARRDYMFADYLGLRLISVVLSLFTIAIIIAAVGYRGETAAVIAILAIAKGIEAIVDVFHGFLQAHERLDVIARSLMLKGFLSVVGLTLAVLVTRQIVWGCVAIVIAWATIFLRYDVRRAMETYSSITYDNHPTGRWFQPRWERPIFTSLVSLSFPLGLLVLLSSLATNLPRYFVVRSLGERELGYFSALAYLVVAGSMVIGAIADATKPRLAKYYAAGNLVAFRSLLLRMIGAAIVIGVTALVVSLLLGRQILILIYGPEFASQAHVLAWLMVDAAIGFSYVFLGTAVTAMRRFHVQLPIHAVSTAVLVVLCATLIGSHGLVGAVWAMLGSGLVEAAAYLILLRKIFKPSRPLMSGRVGAHSRAAGVIVDGSREDAKAGV